MATAVAHTGHDADAHGATHQTNTGLSNEKLAMWAFLGSECLLFGALISTYLLYKGRSVSGPRPHQIYDIPFTSASSFLLLMSSLTMVLAVSAAHRGDNRRTRLWLTTTALLGATFVGGQVYEFTTFYREGLGFTTNIFGSAFYTLSWASYRRVLETPPSGASGAPIRRSRSGCSPQPSRGRSSTPSARVGPRWV